MLPGKIASQFAKYPQYTIFNIDSNITNSQYCKSVDIYKTAEEYEKNAPSFDEFFKSIDDEVLFICVGSSPITALSLAILESVQKQKITVLYVRPDLTLLSDAAQRQEKLTFNVFQQYARSGLFYRLYLVDNVQIEQILGDIPITKYYETINETISYTFHMLNVFRHNKPLLESQNELPEIAKIATFGIQKNGEDKSFFQMSFITNQVLYFAYNKTTLESDGKIFQNIKRTIKEKNQNNTKTSFGIYSTEQTENYTLCEWFTHFVQEEKF